MSQEQTPDHLPLSPRTDPYEIAFAIGDLLLEYYQEQGEMMWPSEIESELQQEERFDQMARLYRWVCRLMELSWPPPPRKLADEVTAEFDLEESGWI